MEQVGALLDESVAAHAYVIHGQEQPLTTALIDLSQIDFEALRAAVRGRAEAHRGARSSGRPSRASCSDMVATEPDAHGSG